MTQPYTRAGVSGKSHAFVQLLDGTAKKSQYYSFDAALFRPSDRKFELALGGNSFSAGGMTSVISLTLTERGTDRVIFTGKGRNGSIEIFGDTATLMPR